MKEIRDPPPVPSTELTPEQRRLQERVRSFVEREIEPLDLTEREWRDDPHSRVPWDVIDAAAELDLHALAVPKEYGGQGASPLELCIAVEELAVGDLGVAVIFDQNWKISGLIHALGDDEQCERFFEEYVDDPRHLLAICATEPKTGSDNVIPYEGMTFETTAEKDSDEWVINGKKRYISNGADAKTYVVRAQTDTSVPGPQGASQFLVPADAEGLEVTHIHEKMSQRLINNATLEFTDLRVPEENLLGGRDVAIAGVRGTPNPGHIEAGASTLGVARAAFETAFEHAQRREQSGRPIIQHQSIAHDFADMVTELQAARSLLWTAARASVEKDELNGYPMDSMAKVFAAEKSMDVCLRALEMFGGAGIMLENEIQKYFRDAVSFLHSDGTQRAHREKIANELRGIEPWAESAAE